MRHVLRPNEQEGPPHLGAAILLLLSITRIKATLISITLPSVVDKWCEILDRVDTVTTIALSRCELVPNFWVPAKAAVPGHRRESFDECTSFITP